MFMAHVAHCYPDVLKEYAQELLNILSTHSSALEPQMRMVITLFISKFNLILCLVCIVIEVTFSLSYLFFFKLSLHKTW